MIVESFPEINGVVTGPVLVVKLRFNSRIDGSLSKLSLTYPDGSSRGVHLLEQKAPDWLFAKATDLLPGMYELHWQVLASDGHITQGTIPFTVV